MNTKDDSHVFHVHDFSSWEEFEEICNFFIGRCGAELLSRVDGPDARVWKIRLNDATIHVVHDDMIGNFFFPEESAGKDVAQDLAAMLREGIRLMTGKNHNTIREARRMDTA